MKWHGKAYAVNSAPQQVWARSMYDKIGLQPGHHLLDVGCGDGKLTFEVKEHCCPDGEVTLKGIDLSASQIEAANELAKNKPENKKSSVSFEVEDAQNLGHWKPDQFDRITSFTAIHWVEDHVKLMAGLAHVLRSGGRLCFTMPFHSNLFLVHIFQKLCKQEQFSPYLNNQRIGWWIDPEHYQRGLKISEARIPDRDVINKEQFRLLDDSNNPSEDYVAISDQALNPYFQLAKQAYIDQILKPNHMQPVEVEVRYFKDIFDSENGLRGYVAQWNPYKQLLPEAMHDAYIDEFMKEAMALAQRYNLDFAVSGFYQFQVVAEKA
jgi:ubiquinone/menaquinone biosynthesis C-methylase UbiE